MSRLFVAVWPPGFVADGIEAALRPLAARYPGIRWQPRERWHLTLAFLGERDERAEVARFLRIPAVGAGPLQVAGAGRFGAILWLGVTADDWLADLAASVQRMHHCPDRRFRAHITVGRTRSRLRELRAAREELSDLRLPEWTPREFTLVRSTTGPRPSYEVLARSRLRIGP